MLQASSGRSDKHQQEQNSPNLGFAFCRFLYMFIFSYRGLVLVEDLVVLGHGDAEDDGRHVLEAVDPLLPLRPLTPHVKQPGEQGRPGLPYYVLNM